MTDKPPTYKDMVEQQFKHQREIAELRGDRNKWRYHATQLQDQSTRIAWLENHVAELEKRLEMVK